MKFKCGSPFVLVAWCLFGVLLALPGATVLNHQSAGTDYFIPLNGAWATHCNAPASSPLGPLFYWPYQFVASIIGMGEPVMRWTQAMIFVVVSAASWFALRKRFSDTTVLLSMIYLSLFATTPVNMGDSPFIIYQAGHYNTLAMALGQLAILVAWFPRGERDDWIVGTLLACEMLVKPNLAVMDMGLIAGSLILLGHRTISFATWALNTFLVEVILLFVLLPGAGSIPEAIHQAVCARGGRLAQQPFIDGGGNALYGATGLLTDCLNRLNSSKLFGLVAMGGTGVLVLKCTWRVAAAMGLLVGCDLARTEFNSVAMCWPFTLLIACVIAERNEV
jgi:hypothetical protein